MFSVLSVCSAPPQGSAPAPGLFKLVLWGTLPWTCSNLFTCCQYIYWRVGGWPSTERPSCDIQNLYRTHSVATTLAKMHCVKKFNIGQDTLRQKVDPVAVVDAHRERAFRSLNAYTEVIRSSNLNVSKSNSPLR